MKDTGSYSQFIRPCVVCGKSKGGRAFMQGINHDACAKELTKQGKLMKENKRKPLTNNGINYLTKVSK
jgi:hypothetical protein